MPRFVLLRHEMPAGSARESHFDLMLEDSGVLWTWALAELPAIGTSSIASRLADHRLAYLDYEGEISGGRGQVQRVDAGDFTILVQSPDQIVAQIRGVKLQGRLTLAALHDDPHRWRVSLDPGCAATGVPGACDS